MKLITCALLLLSSSAVLAMPTVGDYVNYSIVGAQGSTTINVVYEEELVDQNQTTGQFLEQDTATVPGQPPQITQQWVDAVNYPTDASLADTVQNCSADGGTPANIAVPAGGFSTCGMMSDDGVSEYWIGQVPGGLVMADGVSSAGYHEVMTLNAFRLGQ